MDREKAIQILKRCEAESHCEHYKLHYCCIGCGQREALDLAIEALKEPKPVCEDAISREYIVKKLKSSKEFYLSAWEGFSNMNDKDKARCDELNNCIATVINAPSVEPKRPQGEWIEYISDENGARYGRCTSCNKSTLNAVSYDLNGQRHIMDFCPKCGADCRGDKE